MQQEQGKRRGRGSASKAKDRGRDTDVILGEGDFSRGPLKAVIPAKAGIHWEVRLIRAQQF
jgi:hypothetical protein